MSLFPSGWGNLLLDLGNWKVGADREECDTPPRIFEFGIFRQIQPSSRNHKNRKFGNFCYCLDEKLLYHLVSIFDVSRQNVKMAKLFYVF